MDTLVPALVLALLIQPSDRSAATLADLSTRTARPVAATVGALTGIGIGLALAAAGGALLRPRLTPEAARLMLALALLFAGAGWRRPRAEGLDGWRLGAFGTGAAAIGTLALGDATQFAVFALALATPVPALPATGALIGTAAVLALAAGLGERGWRTLPLRPLRIAAALILVAAGLWIGLTALRLL